MDAGLKSRIADGDRLIGVVVNVGAPALVEAAGYAGFDYAMVDGEHGMLGRTALEGLIRAGDAVGLPVLVRVPTNTGAEIGAALDAGATGVQVPMINSRADAERAVEAAHYAPIGQRGLAGARAAHWGIDRTLVDAVADARRSTIVVAQLEDQAVLPHLDDVLDVANVDLFFVGPSDLSQSLGLPGEIDADEVRSAMALIEATGARIGVPLATTVPNGAAARIAFQRGYQVVTTVAVTLFGRASRDLLAEARADG